MEKQKRGPGRPPKADAVDVPLVLTLNRKREKLEIELTTPTRSELDEYLSWVAESEPALTPGELWFNTFEYAITTLLRTDKKWRAWQRQGRGGKAKQDEAPPSPGDIVEQPESVEINPGAQSGSPQPTRVESDTRKPTAPPTPAGGPVTPASPSLSFLGSRDQKTPG
jgi:hypothetical protein